MSLGSRRHGIQEFTPRFAATMLLMNISIVHGVNNKLVDELLSFLHKHLLLVDNCLPTNIYHAKTLTRKVGLSYKIIHACLNGCVLFAGAGGWGGVCKFGSLPKMWFSSIQGCGPS
jgi:hypothetical protein